MAIKLNELNGFCAIMQDSNYSLTKAAERIHIDHTALSRQIASLEDDLGIELFDRSQYKRLKPTKEGQKFYNEIIVKFQSLDSLLKNYSKEKRQERERQINIAGLYVLLERMIPYINQFKEFYPEANISFYNISKEEAFEKLIAKEIDLVFYPGDSDETYPIEIDRFKIVEEKVYWVFYKDHPLIHEKGTEITEKKVSEYPFGILSGSSYSQKFEKFIKNFNIKSPINLFYGTSNMIIEMIKNKMCVSVLSSFYLGDEDKRKLVLKDTKNIFSSNLYSYSLKDIKQKDITKDFLKIVEENKKSIFY